ncbi:serine-protein kinase ATM [Phymastichus coffea]|uniref:serine-protein kinase ATM n=1 Tax=Phymastichus coffea TaxID=108790 RepID=UPI00273A7D7C|nr:serine-protein kinase ATM [Phymastichus coffea]
MTTFMGKVSHIMSLASSKKVLEYKKAIKYLIELWEDHSDTDIQEISNYSNYLLKSGNKRKEDHYSWNDIFIVVHNLFETEIVRISKLAGVNSGTLDKEKITKLLFCTSDKANFYLKPQTVINSTISILHYDRAQIFSEYYEVYLSILIKHVLQERSQCIFIPFSQWQELLDVCIIILKRKIQNLNYVTLLETVELVVRHGCTLSNLSFETKKLLPTIGDLFENYQSYNIKSTDILFKLCFTVCQQIAIDSRYILIVFSESLPLSMIEVKGPEEKYQLYLLFVQAHHPNGAILGDDISHVYDEEKWKAILHLLYKMVLKDIKLTTLSTNHLALACEVFRQKTFIKLPPSSTQSYMLQESAYIQPRKKRRISNSESEEKLIDLVNDRDPERAWPIIQIAACLYKKYPDCLIFHEGLEFLEIIVKLMSQAKAFAIIESICELATVIAQNNNIHKEDDLKRFWDKIWDSALRYLSMSHKDVAEKGCTLVQNLIYYKRISNPESILKLFTTQSIQKSSHSIRTLEVFCHNNVLPNCELNTIHLTNNSLKLQLMQWSLHPFPKRFTSPLSIENFSKLLIGFTLKTWYKQNRRTLQVDCNDEYYINMEQNCYENMQSLTIDKIEQCYLSLNLKTSVPFASRINNLVQMWDETILDNPFNSKDLDYLVNNLLQIVKTDKAEKELNTFIMKTALIAVVISDLKAMNMIKSTLDEFCLVTELQTCLSKIMNEMKCISWSKYIKRTCHYVLEITKALILLYQTKYDAEVNSIIIKATECDFVKKLYEIRKFKNSESNTLQECQINVMIVLALFSCMESGGSITDLQVKIASSLLKLEKYNLLVVTDVIGVLTTLQIFSNISVKMVTDELMELLMDFMLELFNDWHRDDKVTRYLLQLFPKFLDKIILLYNKVHVHNIFLVCKHYHNKFLKGEFGQLVHLSLVTCLNSIIKHTTFSYDAEENVLNDDIFITFIKSSYYLVRLESLKCIHSIFSSKKIADFWKQSFFDKLKDSVENIFVIQRELSVDEIQEERLMRSISVMQILTTIICSQSIFQSSVLLTLSQVIVDKGIETNIVLRTLQAINACGFSFKKIIEHNLNYILTDWCQNRNLDTFPFILLNCFDALEFHDKYAHVIFPVLIRGGKFDESMDFCRIIKATFRDLFKSCSPNIIPWATSDECPGILEQMQNNDGYFQQIDNLSELVRENLQQIIIETVQRLHDTQHFYVTFKTTISLPKRDPPYYKYNVVDQCFDHLMQILSNTSRETVFNYIITRQPSIIQKSLLQLTRNIYTSSTTEFKAISLHQYVYFCEKIISDLKESHCDIVALYFIKDIVSTLIHLVKEDDAFIVQLAGKYLLVFLEEMLPNRSAQLVQIFDFCVKQLVPLIQKPNGRSLVKVVLEFFLDDQKECFAEAVNNLACLLDTTQLGNYRPHPSKILQNNLVQFLSATDDHNCSINSLLQLKQQLSTKKVDLEKLYDELESSQGFAEDCVISLLHKLIYRLIQLTKSKDDKISLEAARCLGVLGPTNLFTTILHPQETPKKETDKIDVLTHKLCQILADLIVSSDIELRTVSSDILYILSEYVCRENSENLQDFLYLFRSAHKRKISRKTIKLIIDLSKLDQAFSFIRWTEESKNPYNIWIADVTSEVAKLPMGLYSESLIPLFKLNVQSCEVALPRLITIIVEADWNLSTTICRSINDFFHYHFGHSLREDETPSTVLQKMQNSTARDAVWCVLNIVNYMRIQTDENVILNFDYLTISIAAQFCSAYFSSILYAELWCHSKLSNFRDFDSIPIIEQIYEQVMNEGKTAQDVMREAYMKIGDSDSIHGCGSSHLQNRESKICYYTNFQKLDKLTLSHDVECSIGYKVSEKGLITALKASSHYYLANRLLAMPSLTDPMEDLRFDCYWRLSDWNQVINYDKPVSRRKAGHFSESHYYALQCLHENNKSSLDAFLEQAHFCVIKELNNISLESCKAIYPKLTKLQMLREIEEFSETDPKDYNILFKKWGKDKYFCNNNFQFIEPILTQRTVIFQIKETMKRRNDIQNAFIDTQYQIAQLAQQEGNFNVATRALEIVSKEKDLDLLDECYLKYHEAQLALKRNDEDMANYNLRSIIKSEFTDPSLLAQALLMYGNWIAENKSENPQAIVSKYYEKALASYSNISELSSDDLKGQCKTFAALAEFTHEQYLIISEYMNSSTFESLQECIDYSRNVNNKSKDKTDDDVRKAFGLTIRQGRNDSIEVENIKKDRAMYLSHALSNYLLTLKKSDDHDFLIFRLVSLWLSNGNMYDEQVNNILKGQLEMVSSYKYIPLVPQLAPHMSNVEDIFTNTINKVLRRCALDHPYHTLPVLLALKNLHSDSKYYYKKNVKVEARVLGGQMLIEQLLSTSIGPIIQEMDRISEALVELAYYDTERKKVAVPKCSIPRNFLINTIKDFKHSLVPTINLEIKKTKKYSNIVTIRKYESSYDNVGGMNAPKKIVCFGSDGKERPQLVKGRDDLRQDAVMQQVFTVMNSLLKSNKDAKQRKLYVRTYKVVPLTQRSGVLEWCINTLPLSYILTGDGKRFPGLHQKYFPKNYSPSECRKKMAGAKGDKIFSIFMDCCKNLPPAFHYFFTENYLSPEIWFERRMAYTRSVATTSIIGYILGLGDRHVSNILIDNSTAEVIHIDFGIAFEQGKVLPTPETVPFRLTRDIEAGMGVSGVEGTMRRSCEETMTVLREQKEIIVTLLRVLLYDPLYSWAITPAKAATYQSEHSTRSNENKDNNTPVGIAETNKLAERALLRVQQKLQGIEEGVSSSIPGQVTRLIQQARDPVNLCRLFAGWQAYL